MCDWTTTVQLCCVSDHLYLSADGILGIVATADGWQIVNAATGERSAIPTDTSLPPCSGPSWTSPSGGPKKGPSLTAAVRGSRTVVRAGTEWLRRGPNQRI